MRSIAAAERFFEAQNDAQLKIIDQQISASEKQQDRLTTLAAAGSKEAAKSLAAEAANQAIQGFSYSSQPSISPVPVAQAIVDFGTSQQPLPLSQAAISYYQALGVSVSPETNQSVAAQNSGNATSNSSASANYRAGAAQRAGYSTGSPR